MDYQKQAEDFCKNVGLHITKKFLKHGTHFLGDTHSRDIFKIVMKCKGNKISFTFGQCLSNSDGKGGNPPTNYSILATITKYDPGTFEDFCEAYGYDTGRRSAEKLYKDVTKEYRKVVSLFNVNEMLALQEIS